MTDNLPRGWVTYTDLDGCYKIVDGGYVIVAKGIRKLGGVSDWGFSFRCDVTGRIIARGPCWSMQEAIQLAEEWLNG